MILGGPVEIVKRARFELVTVLERMEELIQRLLLLRFILSQSEHDVRVKFILTLGLGRSVVIS